MIPDGSAGRTVELNDFTGLFQPDNSVISVHASL